jgi:hypothetical protein
VNKGFYKAVIPTGDAKLLWGLENPNDAATALQVTLTTEAGGTAAALKNIAVKNGKIIIDVSGFEYSRPKLKIGIKAGYRPSKSMNNKSTITCVKGKSVKKITAVKPVCPTGYIRNKRSFSKNEGEGPDHVSSRGQGSRLVSSHSMESNRTDAEVSKGQ